MIMSNKVLFSVVVALFVFSAVGLAADFEVDVDYPTQIFAGGHDFVKVTVTNLGDERWFTASEFGSPEISKWFVKRDFTYKIGAGETREFIFELEIPKEFTPSKYGYSIIVKGGGETIEKKISTEILERTYSGIIADAELTCKNCRDSVGILISVKNIGSGVLDDVDLVLELEDEKQKIAIGSLSSKEELERDATFNLDNSKPGNYVIDIELYIDGKYSDQETLLFNIPIHRQVVVDKDVTTTPIGAFVTLKAVNTGNSVDKAMFEDNVEDGWWVSYFGPTPDRTGDDGWTWFATLLPNEDGEISYVLLYWPVPILLVLFLAGAVMGFLHLTGVHISKKIHKIGDDVKISIHVKNLGGVLEGCVVRDLVPNSFILPKDFGTLKPIIRKTAHGTELLWRVGNMRAGEERLVNYNIIPRHVHKHFAVLPAASVKGVKNEKTVLSVSQQSDALQLGKEEKKLRLTVAE